MELRHLRYFVAVAEELHMGRAARRLNISQPPLSRQIRELEDELGFPLFVRGYHRMELTPAGEVYLSEARRILEQVFRATEEAASVARGHTGHLRLGQGTHLPDGYLSRVLGELQQAAPGVTVDVLEGPSPRIQQALRRREIDAAFVMPPHQARGLVVRELLSEPLVIVVPERHHLANAAVATLERFADENFVVCRRYSDPGWREVVEGICSNAGFTPKVRQAVEHSHTVLALVAQGIGVSIVPASAAARVQGVRCRPLPATVPRLKTVMVWRRDACVDLVRRLFDVAEREAARIMSQQAVDQGLYASGGAALVTQ